LILASTSIVGRLKFSANNDSHRAEESVVDQVAGDVMYSTSVVPVICSILNITSCFAVTSESDCWNAIKRQAADIFFNVFGQKKFVFWDKSLFSIQPLKGGVRASV